MRSRFWSFGMVSWSLPPDSNATRNDVAEYFEVPELAESNSGFRFSIRGLGW